MAQVTKGACQKGVEGVDTVQAAEQGTKTVDIQFCRQFFSKRNNFLPIQLTQKYQEQSYLKFTSESQGYILFRNQTN